MWYEKILLCAKDDRVIIIEKYKALYFSMVIILTSIPLLIAILPILTPTGPFGRISCANFNALSKAALPFSF